jgi:hypothetical protein
MLIFSTHFLNYSLLKMFMEENKKKYLYTKGILGYSFLVIKKMKIKLDKKKTTIDKVYFLIEQDHLIHYDYKIPI